MSHPGPVEGNLGAGAQRELQSTPVCPSPASCVQGWMAFARCPLPCAVNKTHVSPCKVVPGVQEKADHPWDLFCIRRAPGFITQAQDGTKCPALCHAITVLRDSSAGCATSATPGFPLHLERDVLRLVPEQPKGPHWLHLSGGTQQSPFAHPAGEQLCPVVSMLPSLFPSSKGQPHPSWLPATVPGLCHCPDIVWQSATYRGSNLCQEARKQLHCLDLHGPVLQPIRYWCRGGHSAPGL